MAHESCKSQIAVPEMNGQSVPQRWTSMREGSSTARLWQAVVDVPPSLQRVVEFLLHVVDISKLYNVFYNVL